MNIKAIVASLVLGSSSVALAAPAVTVTARGPHGTTVVRGPGAIDENCDPVTGEPIAQPIYHTRSPYQLAANRPYYGAPWRRPAYHQPVTLASGLQLTSQGRAFISVGDEVGRFGSLQLSATGGRTFIKQIYVQFENGQTQVVQNLNRVLNGNEQLTVDLDGNRRAIKRIVVYGNDMGRGWRRNAGSFSITAV